MTRETADRYLIYRCAELTLARGYDYFIIIDQAADEETTSETRNTTSTETTGEGKKARTTVKSTNTMNTYTRYNPVRTTKVFRGKKPEDNFKAYDGREITATLAPKIGLRDSADAARASR
ncbi:MAG: hypothetical protein JWQ98_685 [Chlorobi bacterium]|nr:hypothetical protein [Chlorobiota bacterium]